MNTPDFNPCDSSTWRAALTLEQVSAIYQKSQNTISARSLSLAKSRRPEKCRGRARLIVEGRVSHAHS